jgi:(1->4)-alpha-D-glucan 1-alpha-D-glucosylmutase
MTASNPSGRPAHPTATYRLQLTPSFGFAQAIAQIDHLAALGISDLYLSPISEANPGSSHGYDVVDHRSVRGDFGGADGLAALLDAAAEAGLGVIVDHVPNHVSITRAERNEPWWTTLREGRTSPSAAWFDIDWNDRDAVIVPVLGEPIADVLRKGDLAIETRPSGSVVRYADLEFPIAAGTGDLELADLLAAQHYDLVWWRNPARNVRRFFTIDDLVAVRVEDPAVAAVVDTIPVMLRDHPAFRGVRVDHVDGLADPAGYLTQLRAKLGDRLIWVEKIVSTGESIPRDWPVAGTTGYESIAAIERTLLDPRAARHLIDTWNSATVSTQPYEQLEYEACSFVLKHGLKPDLERLHRQVLARSGVAPDPAGVAADDVGDETLAALEAITLGLDRYRTYLPADETSHVVFDHAVGVARHRRPGLDSEIGRVADALGSDPIAMRRWQQLTGPVRAKGAEDRAFYRYLPLASLCEVGGDPGTPTVDLDAFHTHQGSVQREWPLALLAGTTHDTKRSEDVRARSLAVADEHEQWRRALRAITTWSESHGIAVGGEMVSLATQTVATAWPIDAERLSAYLVKAAREAGARTTWADPDESFEAALADLAAALCAAVADGDSDVDDLAVLIDAIERPGIAYGVIALALRLTLPGIPDLYQGTEAFTYTLVDPDNRREPDWEHNRHLVDIARSANCADLWARDDTEAVKACMILRLLHARRRLAAAFGPDSSYTPLAVTPSAVAPSAGDTGVIAYARGDTDGPRIAVIARRRPTVPVNGELTIALPPGTWRDVLDPTRTMAAEAAGGNVAWWLEHFPVAVLERIDG